MEAADVRTDLVIDDIKKHFALNYLMDFNMAFACRRVGIARKTGMNWLKEKSVQDFIAENQAIVAQKCNITQEEVLNELSKIAFFDHKSYMTDLNFEVEEGSIGITLEQYDMIDFSAVQSVIAKTDKMGVPFIEIKPYNKVEALKQLLEWFKNSKIAENVHFHITREDLKNRSAQEITKDYHNMVQNAPLTFSKLQPSEAHDTEPH